MIYITSDLHFGHKSVMKFCPNTRPWSDKDEMNQALIQHWNDLVGVDDTIYHLGDFSFMRRGKTEEVLSQLNGNKIFILGNHDNRDNEKVLAGHGETHHYLKVRHNEHKVVMFHFPIMYWDMMDHGRIHFFGHMHGDLEYDGRAMDVGFDAHGRILTLDEAIDKVKDKPIVKRRDSNGCSPV